MAKKTESAATKNPKSKISKPKSLRVLIIEDNEDDALLIVRELKKGGYNPEFKRVEAAAAMKKALKEEQWDIIICDYSLPKFSAPQAIRLLRETTTDIPLILVSGAIGEETAADCMILGARDFIYKNNLSRLCPAVARELQEARARCTQRLAEEALRESENFLGSVFESIQDGISILDKKLNIIGLNETHKKWYMHKAPLVGKKCYQAYHDRDKPCSNCPSQKTIRTGKPAYKIVPKEAGGKITGWLEIHSFPLKDSASGEIRGVIEYVRDISQRKNTEDALLESESKYRNLVERANDGIAIAQNGVIRYVNTKLTDIAGYTVEELIGKPFTDLFTPEEVPKSLNRYKQRMAGKQIPSIYESTLKHKNGNIIDVELNAGIVSYEGTPADLVIVRDITYRKQTEENLQKSEENFRRSLDESPLGIRIVSENGETIYANEAILNIYGYKTIEELSKTPAKDRYTPESYENHQARKIIRDQGKEGPSEYEISIVRKNGEIRHLEVFRKKIIWNGTKQFQAVYHDITKQKAAEQDLQQSEHKYRNILARIQEGYFEVDVPGNYTFANEANCKLLGYSMDEVIGMNYRQHMEKESAQILLKPYTDLYRTGKPIESLEVTSYKKDGTKVIYETSVSLIRDPQGKPIGFRGISRDITARKRADESLKASEEKYRTILESIEDGYYEADPGGNLTFFNDSTCRISGYGPEESMGMNFRQYTPENEADKIYSNFHEVYETEIPVKGLRYEIIRKDKEIRYVEASISLRKDSAGNKIGFQGILRDITERRQTEQYLEMVKYCMDEAADAVFWMDKESRFTYVNEEACRSLGYTREELLGMSLWNIDPVYSKKQWDEDWKKYEKDGYGMAHIETWHRRKDGLIFPVEVLAKNFRLGDTQLHTAFVRDITERKQAEKALQASEEKYRNILETMQEGYYEVDLAGNTTFVNDAMCRIHGYSREEVIGRSNRQYTDRETAIKVYQEFNEVYRTEKPGKASEHEMVRKDGSRIWIEASIDLLRDSAGNKIGFKGIVRDITERKKAEEAIKERDLRFRKLSFHVPGMIYQFKRKADGTYSVPFTTEAINHIFGCSAQDVVDDFSPITKVIMPDDLDQLIESVENSAKNMTLWEREFRVQIPGQPVKWMFGQSTPEKLNDGSIIWHGFITDITDRKQVQESLLKKHEELETMIESSPIMIFFKDTQNRFTRVNKALLETTALAKEEIEGKSDVEINPLRAAVNKAEDQEIITTGLPKVGIMETVKTRKGTKVLRTDKAPYKDAQGNIVGIVGFSVDITEQKIAQDALIASEEKYRSLIENAQEGVYQTTAEGNFITVNNAFARILGYSSAQEILKSVTDIPNQLYVYPQDRERLLKIVEKYGSVTNFETQLYRKDGSRVWLSLSSNVALDDQKQVVYYQGMIQDISEKKHIEAERLENVKRLRKALGATINAMAVTVETRDPYTAGHQRRVADLARAIATEMKLTSDQIDGVRMAGMIHDIGKISIPSEILTKPTQLSALEFNLIKTHPDSGYSILKDIEFPWPISRIVLEHHERVNGSGYPLGLKENDILMESKILAVADVVEAISSHRPYRAAHGIEAGLQEIADNRDILYDAKVVDACLRLFREKSYTLAA